MIFCFLLGLPFFSLSIDLFSDVKFQSVYVSEIRKIKFIIYVICEKNLSEVYYLRRGRRRCSSGVLGGSRGLGARDTSGHE